MGEQFQLGDVVILKSGGPRMTICDVPDPEKKEETLFIVTWFVDGDLKRAGLLPQTMTKVG